MGKTSVTGQNWKEILLMFEEIIFADQEVLSSERKFYDLAKRFLQVKTYEIQPSVELFEYLNVLNYVSSSDFASIDEFAEIWIKYMGPDIRVYYKSINNWCLSFKKI